MTAATTMLATILDGPLRTTVEHALPAFLIRQRWFGAKSRAIESVTIETVTPLPLISAALSVLAVRFVDGGMDHYQLPLETATGDHIAALTAQAPNAAVATFDVDGIETLLFDGTIDEAFRVALLRAIVAPATEISNHTSELVATNAKGVDPALLLAAGSRVGSAEQSNTSMLFGERAILKLFRRLPDGENPDVEIGRFLSTVTHFDGTPAYLGDLKLASSQTTIAYLQAFAPNQGDGWAWMLAELGRCLRTMPGSEPISIESLRTLTPVTFDSGRLLGERTAQMHLALATSTKGLDEETAAAFAAEPYSQEALAEEIARMREQLQQGLDALELSMPTLDGELATKAKTLLAARERIAQFIERLSGDPAKAGKRIRIHGDFHLGQVLRAGSDFLIVDFEGEPAKSLAQRRRKQTPLKDVAGMLRSFSYAAQTALADALKASGVQRSKIELQALATQWEEAVSAAFLEAYTMTIGAGSTLLPDASVIDALLLGLLLEKAFYELVYELNNRPAWIYLPLEGLLALSGRLSS